MGSAAGAAKARAKREAAEGPGPALPKVLISGIDTLELHTKAPPRPEVLAALESRHRLATERKKERVREPVRWETTLDGELEASLEMMTHGGKGCRYRLEIENVLSLLVHSNPPEGTPAAYVELRSRFLWARGFDRAAEIATELLMLVCEGNVVDRAPLDVQVSRVDLTVDFMGWVPEMELLQRFTGRAVTRGAYLEDDGERVDRQSVWMAHRRFTGFSFGRGAVVARFYDKSREIRQTNKLWFRPLWRDGGGWIDDETSGAVWRLEFQLRREAVRNAHVRAFDGDSGEVEIAEGIAAWKDCRVALGNVWTSLMRNWLSIRLPRGANERIRLEPRWKELCERPDFPSLPRAMLYRHALDASHARTLAALAGYGLRGLAERWQKEGHARVLVRLWSAAPDLFDLVAEMAEDALGVTPTAERWVARARAAIAKARGQ